MMYLGTVVLGMSEMEFWKCTPRKLFALADAYIKTFEGQKEKPQERLTIEELLSWR